MIGVLLHVNQNSVQGTGVCTIQYKNDYCNLMVYLLHLDYIQRTGRVHMAYMSGSSHMLDPVVYEIIVHVHG